MNRVFMGIAVLSGLMAASPVAAQPGAGVGAGRLERLIEGRGERLLEGRGARGPQGRPEVAEDANAPQTMERLQELLQQYPPSLGKVLALDPTLLTDSAYLQPYPQLATLLAQHPEIAHNPSYFFEPQYRDLSRRQYDYNEPRRQVIQAVDQAFGVLAFLVGF